VGLSTSEFHFKSVGSAGVVAPNKVLCSNKFAGGRIKRAWWACCRSQHPPELGEQSYRLQPMLMSFEHVIVLGSTELAEVNRQVPS
jgi:hypothetical protein